MKPTGKLLLITSVFLFILVLSSCSTKNSDSDYGDAYDAEYLMTEYVDQLVRDGAETVVGTVEITGSENSYEVIVHEKKVIPSDSYEEGYYIADRNIENTYPLGSDQGILAYEGDEVAIFSTEDFIKKQASDPDALYTVYLIGGEVELIQPLDPEAAARSAK